MFTSLWTAPLDMVASQAGSWMKTEQVNVWLSIPASRTLQTLLSGRSALLHGEIVFLAVRTRFSRFVVYLCVLKGLWLIICTCLQVGRGSTTSMGCNSLHSYM